MPLLLSRTKSRHHILITLCVLASFRPCFGLPFLNLSMFGHRPDHAFFRVNPMYYYSTVFTLGAISTAIIGTIGVLNDVNKMFPDEIEQKALSQELDILTASKVVSVSSLTLFFLADLYFLFRQIGPQGDWRKLYRPKKHSIYNFLLMNIMLSTTYFLIKDLCHDDRCALDGEEIRELQAKMKKVQRHGIYFQLFYGISAFRALCECYSLWFLYQQVASHENQ